MASVRSSVSFSVRSAYSLNSPRVYRPDLIASSHSLSSGAAVMAVPKSLKPESANFLRTHRDLIACIACLVS